jgi:hypothetical protein
VSDRQDADLSLGDQVDQVVGKPGYRDSSHVEVLCKSTERRSSSGRSGDGPDGDINGGEEGETQAGVTLLIPPCCVFELSRRFGSKSDLLTHSASSSASR